MVFFHIKKAASWTYKWSMPVCSVRQQEAICNIIQQIQDTTYYKTSYLLKQTKEISVQKFLKKVINSTN